MLSKFLSMKSKKYFPFILSYGSRTHNHTSFEGNGYHKFDDTPSSTFLTPYSSAAKCEALRLFSPRPSLRRPCLVKWICFICKAGSIQLECELYLSRNHLVNLLPLYWCFAVFISSGIRSGTVRVVVGGTLVHGRNLSTFASLETVLVSCSSLRFHGRNGQYFLGGRQSRARDLPNIARLALMLMDK